MYCSWSFILFYFFAKPLAKEVKYIDNSGFYFSMQHKMYELPNYAKYEIISKEI